MTTLNIQGQQVEVSDDFLTLTPEQQNATVEDIARQMAISPQDDDGMFLKFMGQLNTGIAEGVGGLVDFINPFDVPSQIFGAELPVTGSAAEGLKTLMQGIDAAVAEGPPESVLEGLGRGSGEAAAAIIPVTKGLQVLKSVGGAVGAFADDALRALVTVPGFVTEVSAGATGGAAREAAGQAGAPPVVQDIAEIAGGLGVPAVAAAGRAAGQAAMRIPGVAPVVEALAPMTEAGARQVAGRRMRGLVGGRERAEELKVQLETEDTLGLTPAQRLEDPNLLGLQKAAAAEDPLLRERLATRAAQTRENARVAITDVTDGDPALKGTVVNARDFFTERLATFRGNMGAKVRRAVAGAEEKVKAIGPRLTETESSARMVARVKDSLKATLAEEKALWAKVPKDARIATQNTRDAAAEIFATTPLAQEDDIPGIVTRLLKRQARPEDPSVASMEIAGEVTKAPQKQIQDIDTVHQMSGLYSKLRQIARNAMAGDIKNKNQARMANKVADAILEDLGATNADTAVGVAINDAHAFSRALHETFDQGAVGRILRRTTQVTEVVPGEVALKKTIGVGGPEAKVAAQEIRIAAADTELDIADFLRGKFGKSITSASDEFTPKTARTFMRNNEELLRDFPELRAEFRKALGSRNAAAMFEVRAVARTKLIDDKSAIAQFKLGQEEKAVLSIISADDPAKTAKSIMATANKDASGLAPRGVKAAFKEYLIGGATKGDELTGRQLAVLMKDKNTRAALDQVFSAEEVGRLERIAIELAKVDPTNIKDVGAVMEGPANQIVEIAARIAGATFGGEIGGGSLGGSIQTANIMASRARALMRKMTNTKARRLLMDAIEDPELFKVLLAAPETIVTSPAVQGRLAPYLVGTTAGVATGEEE